MKMSGNEDRESQVIVKNRRIEKQEKPNFHPDVVGDYLQNHRPGVNPIFYYYFIKLIAIVISNQINIRVFDACVT